MKIDLTILNHNKNKIPTLLIKETVKRSLREGVSSQAFSLKIIELSLVFVSGKEIKELNREYRDKDKETDVLSFSNYTQKELQLWKGGNINIGDLIVCFSFVKKSAKINEQTFEKELAFVVSHGILHLLGFQHGQDMFSIQDNIMAQMAKPAKNNKYGKPKR